MKKMKLPKVIEIDQALLKYAKACSQREKPIGIMFFGLILLAFLAIFCEKNIVQILIPIILFCFIVLALYIIITTRSWHKKRGVFCHFCHKSLIEFGEIFDTIDEGEIDMPSILNCPKCGERIAEN